MKSNFSLQSILILLVVCSASCLPLYFPTPHNAPMLSNKGEFQATGYIGMHNGIQAAYGISDNIGIMANYSNANFNAHETYKKYWSFPSADLGIGYFSNREGFPKFEIYGGAGLGKINSSVIFDTIDDENMLIKRAFIQPAIGTSRAFDRFKFENSFALRFSAVEIYNQTKYFAEPAIFTSVGYGSLSLKLFVGLSQDLNVRSNDLWEGYRYMGGVGLQYKLGAKTKPTAE
jgi:hypothetical protein